MGFLFFGSKMKDTLFLSARIKISQLSIDSSQLLTIYGSFSHAIFATRGSLDPSIFRFFYGNLSAHDSFNTSRLIARK